jgi:integrase/recombinase XerD
MKLSKALDGYQLDITSTHSLGTVKLNLLCLDKLVIYLGDPELEHIKPDDLSRFMAYLRTEYKPSRYGDDTTPLSGSALDNHWKAIRSFYNYAEKNLEVLRPDKRLKRPKYLSPEVKPFSRDEIQRMVKDCEWVFCVQNGKQVRKKRPKGIFDRALILLLLETGLRIGEVSRLEIQHVDLKTGEVLVVPYGTGRKTKPRTVYLGNNGKKALWLYLARRSDYKPNDPLFSPDETLLRDRVEAVGKRCGIARPNPHRYRHTFAIEFLRAGGDVFTLKRLLGHSTLEMVERYLTIAQEDLKRASSLSIADRWKL